MDIENLTAHQVFLLNMQMHKLGLGDMFNAWFYNPKFMEEKDVITLGEFIKMNPTFRKTKIPFYCFKDRLTAFLIKRKLSTRNKSWEVLRNFLIENGFTSEHWIMLTPMSRISRLYA